MAATTRSTGEKTMKPVEYTQENIDKCWCGQCPVQIGSDCARELFEAAEAHSLLPPPERLGGLYCATGQSICDDLVVTNLCNCSACLVWSEHELASNHYCSAGSAKQVGR
jgi:hypothetical protein